MPPLTKVQLRTQFFELIFKDREGWLCLAVTDPKAPRASFSQKFFRWPSEWKKIENFIIKHEARYNMYFCISLLNKAERKKEHCLDSDILWADLDDVNPEKLPLPPPVVIQSSPKRWQAIWHLTTNIPAWQAEDYSRRIAYLAGADKSGWDSVQLLRIPFTINFKYDGTPEVQLDKALTTKAKPLLFEKFFPQVSNEAPIDAPMPSEGELNLEEILFRYQTRLSSGFEAAYTYEPVLEEDWSSTLWKLLHICLRAGMSAEETFVVARSAACNKYARDGRPVEHLWRDVIKAAGTYEGTSPFSKELLQMPQLVDGPASETFVDDYREWAADSTDAVVGFHDLCCFIMLSAIVANTVKLETSAGRLVPNLWGMILGDSTLTRKTTAMRLAMDFLIEIQPKLILASDGTAEGLLHGLAQRPNQSSIFHKDEVSGFFNAMNRREYLAGMQETLTALYDVPPVFTRMLRSETVHIESPAFVFLAGGVIDRVYSAVNENYILSGFLPRFVVISADKAPDRRPLGPPTDVGKSRRVELRNRLAKMIELYASEVTQKVGGQPMQVMPHIHATLTAEAWKLNAKFEDILVETAQASPIASLALPTFDRLSRSLLKMAICLAATHQEPKQNTIVVSEEDMINAAAYIQEWGKHSIDLIINAGKQENERLFDKIHKAIINKPAISKSEIMRHHKLNRDSANLVLDTLIERGQIHRERRGNGYAYWPTG